MELIIKSFFMFQKIKSFFTFLYVMKIFCIFIILFSSNEIEKPSFKVPQKPLYKFPTILRFNLDKSIEFPLSRENMCNSFSRKFIFFQNFTVFPKTKTLSFESYLLKIVNTHIPLLKILHKLKVKIANQSSWQFLYSARE